MFKPETGVNPVRARHRDHVTIPYPKNRIRSHWETEKAWYLYSCKSGYLPRFPLFSRESRQHYADSGAQ